MTPGGEEGGCWFSVRALLLVGLIEPTCMFNQTRHKHKPPSLGRSPEVPDAWAQVTLQRSTSPESCARHLGLASPEHLGKCSSAYKSTGKNSAKQANFGCRTMGWANRH